MNSGETAGSNFQDYKFLSISVARKERLYDPYPEPWPELLYTFLIRRSTDFYIWKLVIPQVFMGILSFIPYYMSPECGERLGFGITLVLAILTTDVISMGMQPVCNETLLMDYVTRLCLIFCILSLV